ncbi:hypothetical protein C1T30_43300, partial [Bacillus sp. MBGLi97]
ARLFSFHEHKFKLQIPNYTTFHLRGPAKDLKPQHITTHKNTQPNHHTNNKNQRQQNTINQIKQTNGNKNQHRIISKNPKQILPNIT